MIEGIRPPEAGGFGRAQIRAVERVTGYPPTDGLLADQILAGDDQAKAEDLGRQAAHHLGRGTAELWGNQALLPHHTLVLAAARAGHTADSEYADELWEIYYEQAWPERQAELAIRVSENARAKLDLILTEPQRNEAALEYCLNYIAEDDLGRFSDADLREAIPQLVDHAGFTGERRDALVQNLIKVGNMGRRGRDAKHGRARRAALEAFRQLKFERRAAGLSRYPTYLINRESGRAVADEEFEAAEIARAEAEHVEAVTQSGAVRIKRERSRGAAIGTIVQEAFTAACFTRGLTFDVEDMVARFADAAGDASLAALFRKTIDAGRACSGPAETEAAFSRLLAEEGIAAPFAFTPEASATPAEPLAKVEAQSVPVEVPMAPAAVSDDEAAAERRALACADASATGAAPASETKQAAPVAVARPRRLSDAQREAEMEALTHVPGLVGEIVDWITATNLNPNRTLAFAGALALVGTLAGRLYKTPTGIRTNMYALALAPSGFGKDHVRSCLNVLVESARCGAWIGGSSLASGAGLRRRVEEQPACLYIVDEFGHLMRKMCDDKNAHHAAIRSLLLQYFEASGDVFRGEDYAGERGVPVHNPNLSLYGLSNPDTFWSACQSSTAVDGLLARVLAFAVGATEPNDARPTLDRDEPPGGVIDALRGLTRSRVGGNANGLQGGSAPVKALTVRYGHGAEDFFFAARARWKSAAYQARGRAEESIFARIVENGLKIAMIVAIGVDPDRPVLTVERLEHGLVVTEHCAETMLRGIRGRLADNDRQREHVDVLRMIVEAGWAGIGRTALLKQVNGRFTERRVNEILQTLTEGSKEVASVLRPTKGRPGMRFVAVENLGPDDADG